MSINHKISTIIRNPWALPLKLLYASAFIWPDKIYLKFLFFICMKKKLDLKHPITYSEKLQWLKLFNRNPLYVTLADKYAVKDYVSKLVGSTFVIPTLGVWDTPEDIDFNLLPKQFVLKTTHGGGNVGVVICKNKDSIDTQKVIKTLNEALKQDTSLLNREWVYKNIPRHIICEPYIEDAETKELRDYKFFCFNGVVKALFVATERQNREEPYFAFFDRDYNPLPIKQGHPNPPIYPPKPQTFLQMIHLAEVLSRGMPHVRVDLYEVDGKVLFGEYTFFHFAGIVPFEPQEWDGKFGEWLNLGCINHGCTTSKILDSNNK